MKKHTHLDTVHGTYRDNIDKLIYEWEKVIGEEAKQAILNHTNKNPWYGVIQCLFDEMEKE